MRFERGIESINKLIITRCSNLKPIQVEDRRVFPKFPNNCDFKIKFDLLKRDKRFKVQKFCAQLLANRKEGILALPPRQGKTIIALLLTYLLKTKTCILVHMTDLAKQFYDTFTKFTNIPDIESVMKTKIVDINNSKLLPPINIFTYQQFITKHGRERLNRVKKEYGLLIVDEAHRVSAEKYSQVVSRFYSRVRVGLSATPGKEFSIRKKVFFILGKPITNIKIKETKTYYVINNVEFEEPDPDKAFSSRFFWNKYWKKISSSDIIKQEIIKKLKDDLSQNRKILIPLKYVRHTEELAKEAKELFPDKKVTFYHGKLPNPKAEILRKEIVEGKYDCVFATKGKVSLGFNAPLFDTLYVIFPVFDEDNFYQEFSRVRTPHPNKSNDILIRIFSYRGKISNKFKGFASRIMRKYKIEALNDKEKRCFTSF